MTTHRFRAIYQPCYKKPGIAGSSTERSPPPFPLGPIVAAVTLHNGPAWPSATLAAILAGPLAAVGLGRVAWPDQPWHFGARVVITTEIAMWTALLAIGSLTWIGTICASHAITPSLVAALIVYFAISQRLGSDDEALIGWPLSAVLGVIAFAVALAIGPHGYCST